MRPKTTNRNLPPRMIKRTGVNKSGKAWVAYYYVCVQDGKQKQIPLGNNLAAAKIRWAELECVKLKEKEINTFGDAARRYTLDILPQKSPRTQKDYRDYLDRLLPVFGNVSLDNMTPQHIRRYLDARSAKTQANREVSLISIIFNAAREWGYTDKNNPCIGVRKNKEQPRDKYVTDEEFNAVYQAGDQALKDAMDLAYLTGQRRGDILNLKWTDISEGYLLVVQHKTGIKLRIEISGELKTRIDQLKTRQGESPYLLTDINGEKLTDCSLRNKFDKARKIAGVDFHFHDLRAKAASDIDSMTTARKLLGHTTEQTTAVYVRNRIGDVVKPTK